MNTNYFFSIAASALSLLITAQSAQADSKQMYSFEGSRKLAAQQYGEQREFEPTYSDEEVTSIRHMKVRRPTSKSMKLRNKINSGMNVEQRELDETGYIATKSTGYRRKALANRLFVDVAPIVNTGAVLGYERHVMNRFSVGPYAGMMKINKNDAENDIMFAGIRGRWFVMGDADQHGLYAMLGGQYTQVKGKMANTKIRQKLGYAAYGLNEENVTPEVSEFGGMVGAGYQLPFSISNDYKMLLDLAAIYSHGYDVKNEPRLVGNKESLPTTILYQAFVSASIGIIF